MKFRSEVRANLRHGVFCNQIAGSLPSVEFLEDRKGEGIKNCRDRGAIKPIDFNQFIARELDRTLQYIIVAILIDVGGREKCLHCERSR